LENTEAKERTEHSLEEALSRHEEDHEIYQIERSVQTPGPNSNTKIRWLSIKGNH